MVDVRAARAVVLGRVRPQRRFAQGPEVRPSRPRAVPDDVLARRAEGLRARARDAAFVLLSRDGQCVQRDAEDRSRLRDRVLGPRREQSAEPAGRPVRRRHAEARTRLRREGRSDRRQEPARARLARGDQGLLPGLRQDRPGNARARLSRCDGSADEEVSRRRRGEDLLRARAERDLRSQVDGAALEGGRDPRAARQEVSRPPGHHALPHPQLRLRADRAARAAGGQQVREDRARCAARAAHAVAHLLDGRQMAGFDQLQPALGAGRQRLRRGQQYGRRAGRASRMRTISWSTRTCSSATTRRPRP